MTMIHSSTTLLPRTSFLRKQESRVFRRRNAEALDSHFRGNDGSGGLHDRCIRDGVCGVGGNDDIRSGYWS